jgi:hypothetical protein
MLLVSTKYYSETCAHVAFRVYDNIIEIDNYYDSETEKFNPTKTVDLKSEPIIETIYKTHTKDLKNNEKEINATNCDYIAQIRIKINEDGVETEIEWNGIQKKPKKLQRKKNKKNKPALQRVFCFNF